MTLFAIKFHNVIVLAFSQPKKIYDYFHINISFFFQELTQIFEGKRNLLKAFPSMNIMQDFLLSYHFSTMHPAARCTYLNIISTIMMLLRGPGRDIPNKRLSIHLRTILPVRDLTVAACPFTILSASS